MKDYANVFPNNPVTDLGSYTYTSQTIALNKVSPTLFELAVAKRDPSARFRVLPVLAHEVTHWLDHTSTLWGQGQLVQMFNAINARARDDEFHFYEILDFERAANRIRFPEYYSSLGKGALEEWDGVPWLYQFTCGILFGRDGRPSPDHPVLFTRFANHRGQMVCRVPFSMTTLLEVDAMATEVALFDTLVDELDYTAEQKAEERAIWRKQISEQLYDPIFGVYSAAAHCFANRVPTSDFVAAYSRAARVARLCLNVPDDLFDSLKSPAICEQTWGERVTRFKELRDRGYLFYCLVENGSKFDASDVDAWLDRTLEASGLPNAAEILSRAGSAMHALPESAADGPARGRLDDLLSFGLGSFERNGLHIHPACYEGEFMPPVKLSDGQFSPGGLMIRAGSFADPAAWESEAERYQHQLEEFVEACLL